MTAEVTPGSNVAVKVPAFRYEHTVAWLRDVVGLNVEEEHERSTVFAFGPLRLWLDRVDHATHAEVWLELHTEDVAAATERLVSGGGARRNEIEPLGDLDAQWVSDPAGVIWLLSRRP